MTLVLKLANGLILDGLLLDIFEQGSISVVILNQNGNLLYANPLFIVNTEYSELELLELNFKDLMTSHYVDKFFIILNNDLMKKATWKGEIEHKRKNGSIYWTTSHFYKLINNIGVISYVIFEEDITSIKQLTLQLEIKSNRLFEEKLKIESILDNIPFGVLVVDKNFNISYRNAQLNNMFIKEFKKNLLPNSNLTKLFPNIVIRKVLELMKNKTNKEILVNIHPTANWQINILYLETLDNEDFFIIVLRDISSFIEFENIQKQFVTSVSHELRTPITSILLSINNYMSYKDKLDEIQKENLLQIIRQNANVLKNIVEDLLIISKIDNKKLTLRSWNELSLNAIIKDAIFEIKPLSDQKRIIINFIESPMSKIFTDEERLSQIIRIPLENAVKYSKDGSEINISLTDNYFGSYNSNNEKGVLLIIEDFGIGIKKNEIKYSFKRFYRGSNIQNIQGTGIGLSILKELLQLIKAQVFIESEENKGTRVIIFIPRLENRP